MFVANYLERQIDAYPAVQLAILDSQNPPIDASELRKIRVFN